VRLFFLSDITPGAAPRPGDERTLDAEESRHLLKVMRARPGDPLRLTDGEGRYYDAKLLGADGGRARLGIVAVTADPVESVGPRLHLACGVVKGKRFEWALEKAVELGAHEIWPLDSDNAVVHPGSGRVQRWRAALRTAVKQSGRSHLPVLREPGRLVDFLDACPAAIWYGVAAAAHQARPDTAGRLAGPADLLAAPAPDGLAWVVGPEGGWSESELELLASRGTPLRLGPHRLRTETAAAAGLVLLAARADALRRSGGFALDAGPGA